MANFLLCNSRGFCEFCVYFTCMFWDNLSFPSYFHYFDICDIIPKMYNYIIIFRCIAKTNYWGEDTAYFPYHTISQHSPCHVSDGQPEQRFVFEHVSFHLPFLTLNNKRFAWFSPGTFHSPVSTLILTLRTHTMTTVHTTQSHNFAPSLTKTSVCVCLKNINKEPSQQVGVLCTESSGLVSGLNICRTLRGKRRRWYVIITLCTFTRITLSPVW